MAAAQQDRQRQDLPDMVDGGGESSGEADVRGGGLKAILSRGTEPLVDALRSAGVPPHLRSIVMHGIAMCDWAQEEDGAVRSEDPGHRGEDGRTMTAGEGVAALRLMAESMSRFGSPGAFMVPSWGCGSLPEAFVRYVAALLLFHPA